MTSVWLRITGLRSAVLPRKSKGLINARCFWQDSFKCALITSSQTSHSPETFLTQIFSQIKHSFWPLLEFCSTRCSKSTKRELCCNTLANLLFLVVLFFVCLLFPPQRPHCKQHGNSFIWRPCVKVCLAARTKSSAALKGKKNIRQRAFQDKQLPSEAKQPISAPVVRVCDNSASSSCDWGYRCGSSYTLTSPFVSALAVEHLCKVEIKALQGLCRDGHCWFWSINYVFNCYLEEKKSDAWPKNNEIFGLDNRYLPS